MGIKIALAGNPNCGKTTLFNDLTGSSQYVGNWPGVTVEKKDGKLKGHEDVIIQDLPGIYSLSPYTLEEVVTRRYLVNERPDVIINIIDGTNIERNLYLTTQLLELNIPVVIALNMMDLVRKSGDFIDTGKLRERLGCEIVPISAVKGEGGLALAEEAIRTAQSRVPAEPPHVFTGSVEHAIAHIEESISGFVNKENLRWYAIKLFERDEKVIAELGLDRSLMEHLEQHIVDCEKEMDDDAESIIINQRYAYINTVVSDSIRKKRARHELSVSDKIDQVVTNRILALPIFAVIMFLVYYISVTTIGTIVTDFTNDTLFGAWIQPGVQSALEGAGASGWVVSLVVDGIIGGLAAPIGFAPQMAIVFLFLSILEDCGYMARVAFIMDRIFRRFGLSGKSFIPFLISSGCGVPGIMATRTIENEKDRRMTMMTTTFIPCGAKLPVIATISGYLMGGAWWVAPTMYFAGIIVVIVSCIIMKKMKMYAGEPAPFVMEAAAVSYSFSKGSSASCLGESLGIPEKGRNDSVPLLRGYVVPGELWRQGRNLRPGGFGGQPSGRYRRSDRIYLCSPRIRDLAGRRLLPQRLCREGGHRFHHGSFVGAGRDRKLRFHDENCLRRILSDKYRSSFVPALQPV